MKPQKQLIKHDPENGAYGDCQRTCIAAILDMDAADVPHFCDNPNAKRGASEWWHVRQDQWLAEHGFAAFTVAYDGSVGFEDVMRWTSSQNPSVPMILLGTSSLGSNHVVIVLAGEIVCDPSGNGIVGPSQEGTWEVTAISVRDNRQATGQ